MGMPYRHKMFLFKVVKITGLQDLTNKVPFNPMNYNNRAGSTCSSLFEHIGDEWMI